MIKHLDPNTCILNWYCDVCLKEVQHRQEDFVVYYQRDQAMQEDKKRPAMYADCPTCDRRTFFFITPEEEALLNDDCLVVNNLFENKGLHKPSKAEKDKRKSSDKIKTIE